MYVARIELTDYRSYRHVDVSIEPGVSVFVGPNGQGKTNLVEAIYYLATLDSHRAATDTPLVRRGAERAVIRMAVVRDDRHLLAELEINPGRANRARVNKAALTRPRELLGLMRAVLFAPEDLALARGDPGDRRRFLDDLLVARAPRFAAVRQDYDRILKQRNALLRSAATTRRSTSGARGTGSELAELRTLDVWDSHLARVGADLLVARLDLVDAIRPLVDKAYDTVAGTHGEVTMEYRSTLGADLPQPRERDVLEAALLAQLSASRREEIDRGVTLVGPHRDELILSIGELPARAYASQGEAWSVALALRLASFDLLTADDTDPVLLLDDVFAELDSERRERLAVQVSKAEQIIVTAAVAADVPEVLSGSRYDVMGEGVQRVR